MNCPKCNSLSKPSAKFCTTCGFNFNMVQNSAKGNYCESCKAAIKPGSKFCTSCGAAVKNHGVPVTKTTAESTQKSLSVIKDRIFWNVQKGEVARRFNEAEMIQYDAAKGIIINEGTTAFIRSNGVHVAEIKGGAYDFVEPQKLEETLNQRQGGISGGIRAGFRFLSNLVLGRRVKDTLQSDESTESSNRATTMATLIESMKKGQVFSVTLKLDKSFPFVLKNIPIQTKILNATFGMHAFFKIDDFVKFSEYYLSDSDSASFERIQKEFEPIIKAGIEEIVHDHELKEGRLPEVLLQKIKANIELAAADFMYGLKLEKIVEISSNSEDLERFREIERKVYLSERALGDLARVNEIANRFSLTENSQKLIESRNRNEFDKAFWDINKDGLMHQDEIEKFKLLLESEKKIREAKNDDEINAALIAIEKTGLLRTEDLENLKRSIRERSEDHDINRFHSVALLQMNQTLEIDRKKLEWEYEIGDKRIDLDISRRRKELQAEIGYTQLEIERWKTEDDYKDSVFYKELEKRKATQLQDLDIDKARAKTQLELEREKIEIELEEQRQREKILENIEKRKHEQEMATRAQELSHVKDLSQLDKEKQENLTKIYQGMSFEQIMAANPNLTPEAAAALAKKFEKEAEAEKFKISQLQNDMRTQDMKEMMDRMERMSKKVIDASTSKNKELDDLKDQQKDEYKQRLERQEDRMDKTQDKALDYTTKNNSFGSVNSGINTPPPPTDYFVNLPGENNVPRKIEVLINMVKSGQIVRATNIFTPIQNTWVAAENIPELKPYFFGDSGNEQKSQPVIKSCKNCGFGPIANGARFCPECGSDT